MEGVSPYRSWGSLEVRLGDSSYDQVWAEGECGVVGEGVMFVEAGPFEGLLWCCDRGFDPRCGSRSVSGVERYVVEDFL